MKTFIIITLVSLSFSVSAFAHEFKSKDFCSAKTKDMCAHIGYDKKPTTKEAFVFTLDIINKVKAKGVSDMVINVIAQNKEIISTKWTIRPDGHHWDAKADSVSKGEVEAIQAKYKYEGSEEENLVYLK